jgi:hypothetical protein
MVRGFQSVPTIDTDLVIFAADETNVDCVGSDLNLGCIWLFSSFGLMSIIYHPNIHNASQIKIKNPISQNVFRKINLTKFLRRGKYHAYR